MIALLPWQWALAGFGAFCLGLSKTGVAGLGIVSVALFALLLPPRDSVGIVLIVLICADVLAVSVYRRHAEWKHLVRLIPWAAAGIVAGYFALGRVDDAQVKKLIGGILLLMVVLQGLQRRHKAQTGAVDAFPHTLWFVALTGVAAGFTTMIANAAGPIMVVYLLAIGLPKMAFVGTAAWYFLLLNLFKVPFQMNLGAIDLPALQIAAPLVPCALAGGLLGRVVLPRIDQKLFESLALFFTLAAGLRLLF